MAETLTLADTGLDAATLARLRAVFAACAEVERVWLYGSRARGRYRPGSDLDLAVEGELDFDALTRLLDRLDDLDLPLKIDLHRLEDIQDAALRAAIRREGLLLYASPDRPHPSIEPGAPSC
ncbi:MAG: nucleotidyltransferase domain-containing protein [Thiobacillaceae bacterium]|nr:nucleotidyltransferase domain-containing protein [Thiobacillaceae bacterium]MCX7673354.1 nucleotidyltransferase domain-containing protein [Thiobacillaceae bacterium]MDW8323529.1 nucleotidyltransferase domain-containing protein [Burkholderiales bacterium]